MKLRIKNFILVTILAFVTIGGTTSCGSKKKLAKKEYEAKVAQAKADLNAIIEGTTEWTLEEQKARVEEIEKSDLQNQEIDALIVKAKEVLARELAEAERAAEEERLRKIEEENRAKAESKTSISDYFAIIAAAPDAETANENMIHTRG